jgi:hypothetical protein
MAQSKVMQEPEITPEFEDLVRRVGKSYADETRHILDPKKGIFRSAMHAGFTQARGSDDYRLLCRKMGLTDTGYGGGRQRNLAIITDFARSKGSSAAEEMASALAVNRDMDKDFGQRLQDRNIKSKGSLGIFREAFRYLADVKSAARANARSSPSAPPAPPPAVQ